MANAPWYGGKVARVQVGDRVARVWVPDGTTPEQAQVLAEREVARHTKPQAPAETKGAGIGGMVGGAFNAPRKPRTVGDYVSMGQRAIMEGASELGGMVNDTLTGANIASAITGAPTRGQVEQASTKRVADRARFAAPRTNGERLYSAGVKGVTQSVPFVLTGGTGVVPQLVGGATGTMSSEFARQQGAGPWGQFAAGVGGGLVGYGGAAGLSRLTAPRVRQPLPGVNRDVVEAGERLGVPVRAPDAMPVKRADMARAEASPYGGPMIADALSSDKAVMQAKLAEAGGPGAVQTEAYNFGGKVQGVSRRAIKDTGTTASALYKRADARSNGARIAPTQAIAEIDNQIAELTASGANSNADQIAYLNGLKQDMSKPGGFSITEFQGLRSANKAKIRGNQALTASDAERRLGLVVSKFTDDAEAQLPKPAVSALKTADAYYAQRQDFINRVLKQFLGPRNAPLAPERTAERIGAMARNRADYSSLARFMSKATPDERADIAATLAESLGKGRNGEFSLGALATNIDKTPPNIRRLLFGNDGAAALDDLRILARAKSDTAGGLNNSRSGVVMAAKIGGRIAATATAGGMVGNIPGMIIAPVLTETAAIIGQRRAASLLLNPQFTKAVRAAGNNPVQLERLLGVVATRTPAIQEEIGVFLRAMNDNVGVRVAAGNREEDQREKQPAF